MPAVALVSIVFGFLAADLWSPAGRSRGASADHEALLVIVCAAASAGALLGPLP